jgi:hypothetical protein
MWSPGSRYSRDADAVSRRLLHEMPGVGTAVVNLKQTSVSATVVDKHLSTFLSSHVHKWRKLSIDVGYNSKQCYLHFLMLLIIKTIFTANNIEQQTYCVVQVWRPDINKPPHLWQFIWLIADNLGCEVIHTVRFRSASFYRLPLLLVCLPEWRRNDFALASFFFPDPRKMFTIPHLLIPPIRLIWKIKKNRYLVCN